MRKLGLFIVALIIGGIAFTACDINDNTSSGEKGRINIHITDAPFPIELIASTSVTIDKVEIRKRSEEDSTEFILLSEEEMVIDLMELTNGITEQLASAELEAGNYDLIRLHVVDATVTLNSGLDFDLKIPSGSASGLKVKIQPEFYLEEGQTSDILLDFDVSRSFVVKGSLNNIKGFNFKPVVRGVYMGAAGRIEGNVTDTSGVVLEDAMIKAWLSNIAFGDSIDYVSSFSDELGDYKIIGLVEGNI
ncbi:MAG: DUF4382 domain-containing protein [Eubacteriales bacterium]